MKAIGQAEYGGPEVLSMMEVADPEPGPRDLVVRVSAASINPVDAKVRSGMGKTGAVQTPPLICGWDACGVVEAVGRECTRFGVGEEVYFAGDIGRPGCHAELVAVDERIVGRKPRRLSDGEAAAVPLTAITAWEALIENLGAPDDGSAEDATALIVGGGGGVGSIGIQIAKRVCGMQVTATASRDESRTFCEAMGADHVIDHSQELCAQAEAVGHKGFDYILCTSDCSNLPAVVKILNPVGRICYILPAHERLDLSELFMKRGTISFEMMFARPRLDAHPQMQGALLNRVSELLDTGTLVSTLTDTLDWNEFQEAHRRIDTGHTTGKIVMTVAP
jgi:zinc-binding alcohol dehydrogenase family protein